MAYSPLHYQHLYDIKGLAEMVVAAHIIQNLDCTAPAKLYRKGLFVAVETCCTLGIPVIPHASLSFEDLIGHAITTDSLALLRYALSHSPDPRTIIFILPSTLADSHWSKHWLIMAG